MKKIKHDHKGTKLLKLGIFASLMLAPLLAIAFKCAYVTFNKNAKDSYSLVLDTEYELKQTNTIEKGKQYQLTFTNTMLQGQSLPFIDITTISFLTNPMDIPTNVAKFRFYYNPNNLSYSLQLQGDTTKYGTVSINGTVIDYQRTFNFIANGDYDVTNTYGSGVYFFEYLNNNSLDKAFYYAIDEMKNNELFNWTTNTALYTPTAAMTSGMGITTNALPILITYWLYLTAIYIVIDIVVELFTALTHMITSKLDT